MYTFYCVTLYIMRFYLKLSLWLWLSLLSFLWLTHASPTEYYTHLDRYNITNYCSTSDTSCDIFEDGMPYVIRSIASGTFINHTNLTSLRVWWQILSIERWDFNGLINLTELYLWWNKIALIDTGAFNGLINLTSLDLSSNLITSIESWDFTSLDNLTSLDLYGNKITSIESWDFFGLNNVQYLYLEGNCIDTTNSAFQSYMSSLNITNIIYSSQLFCPLPVDWVCGSANWISTNNRPTANLCSVGTPSLVRQNGASIAPWSWSCVGTNFASNSNTASCTANVQFTWELNSSNITSGLFNCSTSATSCNINGYFISSIASGTFINHTNLTFLSIGGSQIKSIESWDFTGLENLFSLDLGGGQITSIESWDFAGLNNLNELYLDWNQITSIENLDFTWLGQLGFLDLKANCFNTDDPTVTDYLNTLGSTVDYNQQYVCVRIDRPQITTFTSWSVTESLLLMWPTNKVQTLLVDNILSLYSHTFTENWSHTYDYNSLIDNNNYLKHNILDENWNLPLWENKITSRIDWIDNTPPTITLNGSNSAFWFVGYTYNDPGAIWSDEIAGSGTLIWTWKVNTDRQGTYVITYTVTDSAGNITTLNKTVTILNKKNSWGGWSIPLIIKDNCPNWDYTNSYYDGNCDIKNPITTWSIVNISTTGDISQSWDITTNTSNDENIVQNNIDQLLSAVVKNTTLPEKEAYNWAVEVGIATIDTQTQLSIDTRVTRAELAKMLSIYSVDVLEKTVSDTECKFEDVNQTNEENLSYITKACQLEIMGVQSDGKTPLSKFNPNAFVTRAEFGTALSRTLYGNIYNQDDNTQWREWHLQKLKEENIISVVSPNLQERRWWVINMLYKTVQE